MDKNIKFVDAPGAVKYWKCCEFHVECETLNEAMLQLEAHCIAAHKGKHPNNAVFGVKIT